MISVRIAVTIIPQTFICKRGDIIPPKLNLPEKEIIDLYIINKLNFDEISDIYNCSNSTIYRLLKNNNIKIPHRGEKSLDLPKQEIIDLYIINKLRIIDISKLYGCSYGPIYNILKDNDIKVENRLNLNLPEKEIINLYINDKLTITEISKVYKCSYTTIYNILKNNDIKIEKRFRISKLMIRLNIFKNEIVNLYTVDKLTYNEIGIIYKCDSRSIKQLLVYNNVKLRTLSEAFIISNGLNLPERDIINLYIEKKYDCTRIGKIYNCSDETIRQLLKRNNIDRRSIDEAKLLQYNLDLPIDKIIIDYENGISIYKLSEKYNCGIDRIINNFKRLNINIRTIKESLNFISDRICPKCGHVFRGKPKAFCPNCNESGYCYKYDEDCKEHNREKYDRECFFCGKSEEENGRKLDTHHVDNNKNQGCDEIPWKLVPLCKTCHGFTRGDEENRRTWEARILYLHKEYWN